MASFTTPLHGANGTCAGFSTLDASETCMPSCESDFVALGVVKCDGDTGILINTFRCEQRGLWLGFTHVMQHGHRATGKPMLDVTTHGESVVDWTYTTGSSIHSSAAISPDGQNIYFGSGYQTGDDNRLHAIRASNGSSIWTYTAGGYIISSPVISSDGRTIFVGSGDQKLHAVDASNGEKKWAFATGDAISFSSPALSHDGKTVFVGSDDHMLYAVNSSDGSAKWAKPFDTGGMIYSSPTISPDGVIVFVGCNDNKLFAVRTSDGVAAWPAPYTGVQGRMLSPIVSADGSIVFVGGGNLLHAVWASDGNAAWSTPYATGASYTAGAPALSKDGKTVYKTSKENYRLHAVRVSDGSKIWSTRLGGYTYDTPVISADGYTIFVGCRDRNVYAIQASDGRIKWKHVLANDPTSSITVSPDSTRLFVGAKNGILYAIKMKTVDQLKPGLWLGFSHAMRQGRRATGSSPQKQVGGGAVGVKKWIYATGGIIQRSSPAISADGKTIFVGSNDMKLHAVRALDGAKRWTYDVGGLVHGSPAISADGKTIYIGGGNPDRKLHAVRTSDGVAIWTYSTGGAIVGGPSISDDGETIYVGSHHDFKLHAVHASDGTAKWSFTANWPVNPAPSISSDGKTIFAGSQDGHLYAINTLDGTLKWKFLTGTNMYVETSPAISPDGTTIYVGSQDHGLYAVRASDGSEQWKYTAGGGIASSPAISADGATIFVGSADKDLHAVRAADGTRKWLYTTGGYVTSSPAISADGANVFVGSNDNTLHVVLASDGSEIWSYTTGGAIQSSPAISADGTTIYVGSDDYNLYAIEIQAKSCYMSSFTTPLHGANGTCAGLNILNTTDSCVPSCDSGFVGLGVIKCKEGLDGSGKLINTFRCEKRGLWLGFTYAMQHGRRATGLKALDVMAEGNLDKGAESTEPANWAYVTDGYVHSSPIISTDAETIYVGSHDKKLHAVRMSDGMAKWTYTTGSYIYSSPTLSADGEMIYVGSHDEKLHAIQTSNGMSKWTYKTGGRVESSPALSADGETIYVGSHDNKLHAVRTADGTKKWTYNTEGPVMNSPAVSADGATIYIGSYNNGKLHAVRTLDGTARWTYTTGGDIFSSPALSASGETIYIGSKDKMLHAVRASDGTVMWTCTTGGEIHSSPTLSADGATIYVGSVDSKLYAVSASDGTQKWTYTTGDRVYSSPALSADGTTIYVGSYNNELHAVRASDGAHKWTYSTGGDVYSSPAISADGGTIYVGSYDNKLHAIAVKLLERCSLSTFTAPKNGALGSCANVSALDEGSSCTPTCDSGFVALGVVMCDSGAGSLINTFLCKRVNPTAVRVPFFLGKLGKSEVFGSFETATARITGSASFGDQSTFLERLPASIVLMPTTWIEVCAMCSGFGGGSKVCIQFRPNSKVFDYFKTGANHGWQSLSDVRVVSGVSPTHIPTMIYTGNGNKSATRGWVVGSLDLMETTGDPNQLEVSSHCQGGYCCPKDWISCGDGSACRTGNENYDLECKCYLHGNGGSANPDNSNSRPCPSVVMDRHGVRNVFASFSSFNGYSQQCNMAMTTGNEFTSLTLVDSACSMSSFVTPLNGANGTCAGLSSLNASGLCMPSCDFGYVGTGDVKCDPDSGSILNTFQCIKGVPSAPSTLEVRVVGEEALSLRIGYPDDDGGANATHFSVYRKHTNAGCYGRNELGTFRPLTISECRARCDADKTCVSFEYHTVSHPLAPKLCQLSTSCVTTSMDVGEFVVTSPNVDLYTKHINVTRDEEFMSTTFALIDGVAGADATPITVVVAACSVLGCSTESISDSTGVPSAPSSLEVRVVGEEALSLRIGYPDDDGGANATHFSVYRKHTNAGCYGRNELGTFRPLTISECRARCDADKTCVSFEYHTVSHPLAPKLCQLSTSCVTTSMDVGEFVVTSPNVDLYTKHINVTRDEEFMSTTFALIDGVAGADATPITVVVAACSVLGCSTESISDSTGVPSAPSSLEVRVVGEDQLSVIFGYPQDDGGANVTLYNMTFTSFFEIATASVANSSSLTSCVELLGSDKKSGFYRISAGEHGSGTFYCDISTPSHGAWMRLSYNEKSSEIEPAAFDFTITEAFWNEIAPTISAWGWSTSADSINVDQSWYFENPEITVDGSTNIVRILNGRVPDGSSVDWNGFQHGYIRWNGVLQTFGEWTSMYAGCSQRFQVGSSSNFRSGGGPRHTGEFIHTKCNDYKYGTDNSVTTRPGISNNNMYMW
eukprot:g58.t1